MKFRAAVVKISFISLVFVLATAFVFTGCRKSSPQPPQPSPSQPSSPQQPSQPPQNNVQKETSAPVSTAPALPDIKSIVAAARTWSPILSNFYGKQTPDFTVTDIRGKTHKLSDYRGKDVMIVFWATWCMPCKEEIPHLIALRNIFSVDKLAILAISNESVNTVKAMADEENMNYTVISYQSELPGPFGGIESIPTAFFIRPDGTLKICTQGGLQLGEMKAIILAK
jgi:peroxiredoxin